MNIVVTNVVTKGATTNDLTETFLLFPPEVSATGLFNNLLFFCGADLPVRVCSSPETDFSFTDDLYYRGEILGVISHCRDKRCDKRCNRRCYNQPMILPKDSFLYCLSLHHALLSVIKRQILGGTSHDNCRD